MSETLFGLANRVETSNDVLSFIKSFVDIDFDAKKINTMTKNGLIHSFMIHFGFTLDQAKQAVEDQTILSFLLASLETRALRNRTSVEQNITVTNEVDVEEICRSIANKLQSALNQNCID